MVLARGVMTVGGEGRPIGFGSALLSDRLPGLPDKSFSFVVFAIRAIMVFSMNHLSVILPSTAIVIAFAVGGARFLIKKYVEKTVDASFERRLENLRSDLRVKEGQISALQTSALNNRAGRDSIIERRRIEAAENLWKAAIDLRAFKMAAMAFNSLNIEAVSKRAETDTKIREMIGIISGLDGIEIDPIVKSGADMQRLFLPVDAWATFNAIRSLMFYAYTRLKAIQGGIEDSGKLVDGVAVLDLVRIALPGYAPFIDQYGINGLGRLIEPLEELLFSQLQNALNGEEADAQAVERSANLLRRAHQIQDGLAEVAAQQN